MRILVVEDQQPKVAKVLSALSRTGHVARDDVDVALSIVEARQRLRTTQYDILVLDVVLPRRAGEAPQQDAGVELLREIMERDTLIRPAYIVGLTAYPNVFEEAAGEFADYTWRIIQYSETDECWADPIEQLVRHVERAKGQSQSMATNFDKDICVICALEMEWKALANAGWRWEEVRVPGDAVTYHRVRLEHGDGIEVVAGVCPRMGMVAAAVLTANMIRMFRPRLVVMIGICAGIRERCSVGDVVVADPSWDYQSGKFVSGRFEIAPHQLGVVSAIRRRVLEVGREQDLKEMYEEWKEDKPAEVPALHIGPFATGSAVLSDAQRLADLKLQHRHLLAIDMEVYGVYGAVAEASVPAPYGLAIKGVSDFGDETKGEEHREFAAFVSARTFMKFVLQEYSGLRRLLWPT